MVQGGRIPPALVRSLFKGRMVWTLLLPFYIRSRLAGIIAMGFGSEVQIPAEKVRFVSQFADQVGVAFSNALLMEELNELNVGTITALARTVDAKSPWTAGHSERVTALALQLGREMGLGERELSDLQRAGLLHDVGKIGISNAILDKPGRLDEHEFAIIQKHPQMGARILEPISSFEDSVRIILQHHERLDGSGYPFGLSGNAIVLGARILSVADVYDALISDRPYRSGWEQTKALSLIKDGSGKKFDPTVVGAFFTILSKK